MSADAETAMHWCWSQSVRIPNTRRRCQCALFCQSCGGIRANVEFKFWFRLRQIFHERDIRADLSACVKCIEQLKTANHYKIHALAHLGQRMAKNVKAKINKNRRNETRLGKEKMKIDGQEACCAIVRLISMLNRIMNVDHLCTRQLFNATAH